MNSKGHKSILFLVQAAFIAAIYTAITLAFAPISFNAIQVRVSEALTILPAFTPAAIPGLLIGCFLGNMLGGGILPDMIFGSLATLLGAVGTFYMRKKGCPIWLCTLPPIIANTLIIPFVLYFGYGLKGSTPFVIFYYMLTILIGEVIACGVGGWLLGSLFSKSGISRHLDPQ